MEHPLEPDRLAMEAMAAAAVELLVDFVDGLPSAPSSGIGDDADALVAELSAPPGEGPGEWSELLDRFRRAAALAVETAGPSYMAYVPSGGLYTSALAEMLARGVNRFTGLSAFAPALVAMEESTVRWLGRAFGLPEASSGGQLTTGGSLATLIAVVAAREDRLGDDIGRGTAYVTAHTHQSFAKAARIAGIRPAHVRTVPTTPDLRMDPVAAAEMIAADRATGLVPFVLVGTAGTTNTGTVDGLDTLADVAAEAEVWFHVDGAYGGFFQLTDRGRARLTGIERADSLVLDPHKCMFLPYGTGAALVRDRAVLRRAFAAGGDYLQDAANGDSTGAIALPDYADLGPELTRDFRGLRLWLPLHLHGVAAFRDALDEKLDLAAHAHQVLAADDRFEVAGPPPDLSTVAFRLRADDAANERLLARVNATNRIFLSSTRVDGRFVLRLCIVSHRTHLDRVDEALTLLRSAAGA